MKKAAILLFIMSFACSNDDTEILSETPFIKAVDLSFLPMIEGRGINFKNLKSDPVDVLTTFKENGINTVRLRIWNNPSTIHSSLEEVLAFSKLIHAMDLQVWLSFHYSDTWADPGNQEVPKSWEGLEFQILKDSLFNYTFDVVNRIKPEIVQIGNEINNGFIHPYGLFYEKPFNTIELIETAISATKAGNSDSKIMIHYAGTEGARFFFDELKGISYDMIGISYYPIWHGRNLINFENSLQKLKSDYEKDILIAETAYPFTLDWADLTNNIVGDHEHLVSGFPATPDGQRLFLTELLKVVRAANGTGLAYWGADYVAFDGHESSNGSSWENQALFDFDFQALPAITAFNE